MKWEGLACADVPGEEIAGIIGAVPKRWGRMDLASRVALVAVGRLLRRESLLGPDGRVTGRIGLVAATGHGCLAVDLAFCRTVEEGRASPMLFGYTLANIPLAEAASHYGLTGPVYAVYGGAGAARDQAALWLGCEGGAGTMIYGELDVPPGGAIKAEFEVIR